MKPEKTTESEEILEFRFVSEDRTESDFSYNEAVMDESLVEFLGEKPPESH